MKSALKKFLPKALGAALNVLSFVAPKAVGSRALKIFRTPREGEILPEDAEVLKSADLVQSISHRQGISPAYVWNPKGRKTVFLLHGWESNAARWFMLIPMLVEKGLKVVAIDAPAHGAATGSYFDMVQYSEALDATVQVFHPDFLVGHSLGGKTLGYYGAHHSTASFEKLVLMGVPSDLRPMVDNFKKVLGLSTRAGRAFDSAFEAMFQLSIDEISVARYAQDIPVPTLVIHDVGDDIALVADGHRIAAALPNSELFITDGLGHALQGDPVFDRVVEWLT